MGKSDVEAPDVVGAAREEAQASRELNEQQTYANRPEQWSPYGTTSWANESVWDEATNQYVNRWIQNEQLTPELQQSLDAQTYLQTQKSQLASGMFGRMADEFGNPIDWSQYGDVQGLDFDPTELRIAAEDAMYQKAANRLDPQFASQSEQLDIKLRNQGLRPGDQAYDAAVQNLGLQKNDAYEAARLGATQQGMGESNQMYNQQMGASQYANQLRQQQMTEDMTARGFSLNEINAIISGQQVQNPQFENFSQAGRAQAPQLVDATIAESNFDQAQAQASNSALGSALGTAGTIAMGAFSDRRLKRNISLIGTFFGYGLYFFEYVWGKWAVGVMSDEINQDAVLKHRTGYDMVDYSKIRRAA